MIANLNPLESVTPIGPWVRDSEGAVRVSCPSRCQRRRQLGSAVDALRTKRVWTASLEVAGRRNLGTTTPVEHDPRVALCLRIHRHQTIDRNMYRK